MTAKTVLPRSPRVDLSWSDEVCILALAAASAAALLAFPLVSFALSTGLLLVSPRGLPGPIRVTVAIVAALSLSLLAGSRPIDPESSNDIFGYYENYQELLAGDLSQLFNFGGGLEVAGPLLFWLWGVLLPELSPNGLMFCLALTASLLFVTWVERTYYASRDGELPALMGLCLLMLNLYFATQLSRQFLSIVVLLYAITAHERWKQVLFLLLASAFHLTALPLYGVYLLARRGPAGWVALTGLALLLRWFFVELLVAIELIPAALASKLEYYVDNADEYTVADLTSLRMIFLLGVISLISLAAARFRPDPRSRHWLVVPWVTAAVHLILLPIPLASLRVTLVVHSLAPGLIAFQMMSGRARAMLPWVVMTLFGYKIVSMAIADNFVNLVPTATALRLFVA